MSETAELSDDAKALMGGWFCFPKTVTLHLVESEPTPRARAALDELVSAGAISKEPFNRFGGEVYKALICGMDSFRWLQQRVETDPESVRWTIMQPIGNGKVEGDITVRL